jgi:hypothetical protein
VADSTRDADADVIVSGREPRRRSQTRLGGLVWLLVVAQAAALAVAAAVAAHYHAEAGRPGHGGAQLASPLASPMPRADGTADLTGYTWTGAVAHRYWMALDPSPAGQAPGLHGYFAAGTATPFRVGQAPCGIP